jgi:asparagine synthase (glutamine-hydrolysing)
VLPPSVLGRRKSPYPSTQDPGYAMALQQQAKAVLADSAHPVHTILDQDWLTSIVDQDVSRPSDARRGIDRVLDLYHWFDLYQPSLDL